MANLTPGKIPITTGPTVIGDSPLTDDGAGGLTLEYPAGTVTESFFATMISGHSAYFGLDDTEGWIGVDLPLSLLGNQTLRLELGGTPVLTLNDDLSARFAGNVIQAPSASVTPANNGDLMVQATSNTQITFKFKGSDGVVRSGSITLT